LQSHKDAPEYPLDTCCAPFVLHSQGEKLRFFIPKPLRYVYNRGFGKVLRCNNPGLEPFDLAHRFRKMHRGNNEQRT